MLHFEAVFETMWRRVVYPFFSYVQVLFEEGLRVLTGFTDSFPNVFDQILVSKLNYQEGLKYVGKHSEIYINKHGSEANYLCLSLRGGRWLIFFLRSFGGNPTKQKLRGSVHLDTST